MWMWMGMNTTAIYQIIFLSLVTSAISITVTKASIFESFREWILRKSKWLGSLVSCPYCFSHWVTIGLVLIYMPVVFPMIFIIDLIMSAFAIVAISALISGGIMKLMSDSNETGVVELEEALTLAQRTIIKQTDEIKKLNHKVLFNE